MLFMIWATNVLQWREQRGAKVRAGANPKNASQFGLQAATRLHEVGIASNRGSAYRGEYVPGLCTHRPSDHESREHPKPMSQREIGAVVEGGLDDWG